MAAVSSVGGIVDLSRDDPDFAAMCNLLGFNVDGLDDSLTNLDAVTEVDAFATLEASTEIDARASDLDAPDRSLPTLVLLSEDPMPLRRC